MLDDGFAKKVAYLVNFFTEVDSLSLSIQCNTWLVTKVAAFRSKIQFLQKRVQDGDTIFFPQMMTLLDSMADGECNFCEISAHLLAVIEVIQRYFPGLDDNFSDAWIIRHFFSDG